MRMQLQKGTRWLPLWPQTTVCYSFHLGAYLSTKQAQWRRKMEDRRERKRTYILLQKSDERKKRGSKARDDGAVRHQQLSQPFLMASFHSTDKMMIDITHVYVRLRVEHKAYCSLNEPWPCWAGLTNGVKLWVGDSDSRIDTLILIHTVCNILIFFSYSYSYFLFVCFCLPICLEF